MDWHRRPMQDFKPKYGWPGIWLARNLAGPQFVKDIVNLSVVFNSTCFRKFPSLPKQEGSLAAAIGQSSEMALW